jgi:hypothetical protein
MRPGNFYVGTPSVPCVLPSVLAPDAAAQRDAIRYELVAPDVVERLAVPPYELAVQDAPERLAVLPYELAVLDAVERLAVLPYVPAVLGAVERLAGLRAAIQGGPVVLTALLDARLVARRAAALV